MHDYDNSIEVLALLGNDVVCQVSSVKCLQSWKCCSVEREDDIKQGKSRSMVRTLFLQERISTERGFSQNRALT